MAFSLPRVWWRRYFLLLYLTTWHFNSRNKSGSPVPPASIGGFFFFLFIHYSRATYGDHGEIMYSPVPVRCPRSGGTLLAPLLPSAQAYPVKI